MIPLLEGNDKGIDFYIIQCQKSKFEVQEDFVCPWKEEFHARDNALIENYYQKYGRGSTTFVLLDNPRWHISVDILCELWSFQWLLLNILLGVIALFTS